MIKVYKSVPEVYYDHSRDFQLVGRLYEAVFNYLKTGIDSIYDIPSPDLLNKELLELLSLTLGFKSKHNYPLNQLRAICSCLSDIIKNKGTINAVKTVVRSLLKSEGINDLYDVSIDRNVEEELILKGYEYYLRVLLPPTLTDVNLYNDLLDYIIPAGLPVETYYQTLIQTPEKTIHPLSEELYGTVKASYVTSIVPEHNNPTLGEITGAGKIDNSTYVAAFDIDESGEIEEGTRTKVYPK